MFSSLSWTWFSFFSCMQNASVEECFLSIEYFLRADLDACTSAPILPEGRIERVSHNPSKAVEKEGRGIFRYICMHAHVHAVRNTRIVLIEKTQTGVITRTR